MKQALNDVYANKQQQTQGYGQNYSQYGGSPLAGGYQPNMPTGGVNINYPQNPYSGNQNYSGLAGQIPMPVRGGYQTSPISEAIGNLPFSPSGNKLNWGSGFGSGNQTRDDIIANFGRPMVGPIGSKNQTRFDMMKAIMNSGRYPWTSRFDMYDIGKYDTYDEWKNAFMTQYPNNDILSTYQRM